MGRNRREILKDGIKSLAGLTIVMMIPRNAKAQRIHDITGSELPEWMHHYYAYVIDTTKCIGCGSCVRACKRENDVLGPFFRTWVERYQITSDNHVYVDSPNGGFDGFTDDPNRKDISKGFFVPKMCNHCRNTPCTQVCPVSASYMTPDGVILVDKKRCIGCGYCVQACPYGSRYLDPKTHTADKCTWCYHRITKDLDPACATVCPAGARKFGDVSDKDSEVYKILATVRTNVLKPELNTEPFCFYIGIDKAVR